MLKYLNYCNYEFNSNTTTSKIFFYKDKDYKLGTCRHVKKGDTLYFPKHVKFPRVNFRNWGDENDARIVRKPETASIYVLPDNEDFQNIESSHYYRSFNSHRLFLKKKHVDKFFNFNNIFTSLSPNDYVCINLDYLENLFRPYGSPDPSITNGIIHRLNYLIDEVSYNSLDFIIKIVDKIEKEFPKDHEQITKINIAYGKKIKIKDSKFEDAVKVCNDFEKLEGKDYIHVSELNKQISEDLVVIDYGLYRELDSMFKGRYEDQCFAAERLCYVNIEESEFWIYLLLYQHSNVIKNTNVDKKIAFKPITQKFPDLITTYRHSHDITKNANSFNNFTSNVLKNIDKVEWNFLEYYILQLGEKEVKSYTSYRNHYDLDSVKISLKKHIFGTEPDYNLSLKSLKPNPNQTFKIDEQ